MNISQNVGIENTRLTYSLNSLVTQGFPEKVGEDAPVDPSAWSQKTTPEADRVEPPPKLGRYINVWA